MFTGTMQNTEANKKKTVVQRLLSLLFLSVFALTIFVGKAHAQIIGDLNVNVPFQFHAGNAKFPAGKYRIPLLSGYKPNRISWLELSSNSDWESNASNTCKMGTFSRLVMLKICRIW